MSHLVVCVTFLGMRFDVGVDKELCASGSPPEEGWQRGLTWAGTLDWLQVEVLCCKWLSAIGCFCLWLTWFYFWGKLGVRPTE